MNASLFLFWGFVFVLFFQTLLLGLIGTRGGGSFLFLGIIYARLDVFFGSGRERKKGGLNFGKPVGSKRKRERKRRSSFFSTTFLSYVSTCWLQEQLLFV